MKIDFKILIIFLIFYLNHSNCADSQEKKINKEAKIASEMVEELRQFIDDLFENSIVDNESCPTYQFLIKTSDKYLETKLYFLLDEDNIKSNIIPDLISEWAQKHKAKAKNLDFEKMLIYAAILKYFDEIVHFSSNTVDGIVKEILDELKENLRISEFYKDLIINDKLELITFAKNQIKVMALKRLNISK